MKNLANFTKNLTSEYLAEPSFQPPIAIIVFNLGFNSFNFVNLSYAPDK